MTEEQYEVASKLLDELNALKKARSEIEESINRRTNQMRSGGRYYGLEWLKKKFASLVIEAEKLDASMQVHHEFSKPVEIPVDQDFVSMVMEYLDKRIDEKTQQLSEL